MSEESIEAAKVAIEGELNESQQPNPESQDQSLNDVLKVLHLDGSVGEEAWEKRAEQEHQTHDVQQLEAESEIMMVMKSLGLDPNLNNLDQLANELEALEAWEVKAERTHSADEIDHKKVDGEINSVLNCLGLSEADLLQSEAEEWEVRAEKQHEEIEQQRAAAENEIDVVLQTLGIADSALYTDSGIVIDDVDYEEVWEIKAQVAHNDEIVQRAVANDEIHLVLESCGIVDDHALNEQELFDLNLATEAWELKCDDYALQRQDIVQDEEDIEDAYNGVHVEDSTLPSQETISELTMTAAITSDQLLSEKVIQAVSTTDVSNDAETEMSVSTTAAATVGTVSSPFPEDNVLSADDNTTASPIPTNADISVNTDSDVTAAVQETKSETVSLDPVKKSMFSYLFGSSKRK